MSKLSSKGLLVVALVMSLVTALLVYNYLKSLSTQTTPRDGVAVVVAKAAIVAKTRITAEMVKTVKIPADYVQPGAITDPAKVVGVTARENIVAGEQITGRLLLLEGKSVGFTGLIPQDKRAVTVAVSEVTGVAGFVKPGDRVDVIVTFDQNVVGDHTSKVVLQNLAVLAANRETETGTGESRKENVKGNVVTLAVTPAEAAQLALGEEKGKIRLALRPYLPNEGAVAVGAVTPKDMVGVQASPVKNQEGGDKGGGSTAAAPVSQGGNQGIQVIRGTKVANN
jgi:pilus assembly protein CpaB